MYTILISREKINDKKTRSKTKLLIIRKSKNTELITLLPTPYELAIKKLLLV
jgi:hypothetical protein